MFTRWLLIFSIFFSAVPARADVSGEHFYVLKKDEVVSEVLRALKFKPIYGPNGNLAKLAQVNPDISNLDHVMPSQKIIIPREMVERAQKRHKFTIAANGEIIPSSDVQLVKYDIAQIAPLVVKPTVIVDEVDRTIATAEAPIVAVTVVESPVEKISHTIELYSTYRFMTLSATDNATHTTAEVLSSRDIEAGVAWHQHWHSDFATFGSFGVHNVAFEPTAPGAKILATTEKSTARFQIGAEQDVTGQLHLKYSFDYAQSLFVRGFNSTSVVIDAVAVPSVGLDANFDLLSRDGTNLGVHADGRYMFSAQAQGYSVQAGSKFAAGIFIKKSVGEKSGEKALSAEFGYYQRNQDTSLTGQSESGAYGTVNFTMPLFGGSP